MSKYGCASASTRAKDGRIAKGCDLIGVVKRRRRCTVSHGEGETRRPAARGHVAVDQRERDLQLGVVARHACGILLTFWPDPVTDDALHPVVHIEIVETIGEARPQRQVPVRRQELRRCRELSGEILDNDARFRKRLAGFLIDQHRKLAQRCHPHEAFAGVGVLQVDNLRFEGNAGLVKRDQNLPAV
jgi:hypothetical protein